MKMFEEREIKTGKFIGRFNESEVAHYTKSKDCKLGDKFNISTDHYLICVAVSTNAGINILTNKRKHYIKRGRV